MKEQEDYLRDITEIRSMMERSSKFLSLSGWSGIMAGIYALAGSFIAYRIFSGDSFFYTTNNPSVVEVIDNRFLAITIVATAVLMLAVGTAIWLSIRKAKQKNEKIWNPASKQLLMGMAVPLVTGGLLMLIMGRHGLFFFWPSCSLIFYGLALYNAGRFTYPELRTLGYIQILLGLASAVFVAYGLLFWALGFGVMHIVYGIYIHYKYEK